MLIYAEKVKVNQAAFVSKVQAIATALSIRPEWIMQVINFETGGTFSPSIRNPLSGAVGLIQFMPSTAAWLGTTPAALAGMSNVKQLDFVQAYYTRLGVRGRAKSAADLYLFTFYPAAVGKPDGYEIARRGQARYTQNAGLDTDKNGVITVSDIKARFGNSINYTLPILLFFALIALTYAKQNN